MADHSDECARKALPVAKRAPPIARKQILLPSQKAVTDGKRGGCIFEPDQPIKALRENGERSGSQEPITGSEETAQYDSTSINGA